MLLRRRIGELQLERFIKAADPGRFLRDLLDFFRRCHDELRTPDDYDAYVARLERGELPLPRVGKSKDAERDAARRSARPLPRDCARLPLRRRLC